ncbi:MAG: hypothetical protein IPN90_07790 [Elusimicrobia bacterium]|nr:hypothetical protein [Elusimicrobiota bacterium]
MRKIPLYQLLSAYAVLGIWAGASGLISWLLVHPWDGASPLIYFAAFALAWVIVGMGLHRTLMTFFPLLEGEVPPGSRQEFIYHVFFCHFGSSSFIRWPHVN